jgi:hypothetical protein
LLERNGGERSAKQDNAGTHTFRVKVSFSPSNVTAVATVTFTVKR